MPELNFNALIPRQDFFQGYSEGQQQQNLLAQQAQARQLGDIQIKNAMREQQNAEAEAEAVKGASTLEEMAKRYRAAGLGKQALATEAAISKQKTDRLTQAKTQHELIKGAANQVFANPEAAQQILMNFSRQTGIDVADDLAQIEALGNDPAKVKQWASGIAIEADKLTPKFHSLTIPGKGVQTGTTDISGKFTPGDLYAEQMSEYQKAQNRIAQQQLGVSQGQLGVAQGRLALEQENATKPVFNAATGGFVSPPTKANPQGTFTPVTGVQETKDQQAAVKALKSAGYDPITGEDNISKLISKSTSGGLQAGTAAALAFFGKTTEGRKAIAALEGTANQIATDLAGGKLGAGISNTDRDFIVGALGDVSNPMKTSAERLAGWTAAKNRMMSAGVIPPAGAAAAAPNIDALLNKYK